ncbi:hypothetical protein ABZT03_38770 [Streptomyces sp. NPDC005574]|uniref:hypothetical protein n=1 Tax=Streptomyces sp. NPDC005574 TaxID=3156891 RepID=UPI0033BD7B16
MKIISRVGEWLLPRWLRAELRPVLAFAGAGAALCTGSVVLASRGWAWLCERLDWRERIGALAAVAYLTGYGCLHAPHVARFAIPAIVVGWCVAAWCHAPAEADEPNEDSEDGPTEPDPQDVTDLVRDLIGTDTGILLTALCQPLHAPSTRTVRELLDAAGLPVRPGVRTVLGNGPGVHRKDLPAPPPPADPTPFEAVAAGEDANANANNALRVESREGMTIINDPADWHRTHSLKKAR